MNGSLRRLAALTVVPTVVDVGLLVVLREQAGWILVLADATLRTTSVSLLEIPQ